MTKNIMLVLMMVFGVSGVMAQESTPDSDVSKSKCTTTWVAETGIYTSYVGSDVGDTFHPHPVVQSSTEIERWCNKRASVGVNLWKSLSTRENPSGGTEFDVVLFTNIKLSKKSTLKLDGGTFFVPGARIYKVGAEVTRSFKVSEKVDGEFSNNLTFYRTSIQDELPGGVVNKASVTLSGTFKKLNLSVTPAISVDNNPFSLGNGRVASMAFLSGRIEYPLSKNVSIFASGGIPNPIAGDTFRGFRKSAGIGLTFSIK